MNKEQGVSNEKEDTQVHYLFWSARTGWVVKETAVVVFKSISYQIHKIFRRLTRPGLDILEGTSEEAIGPIAFIMERINRN